MKRVSLPGEDQIFNVARQIESEEARRQYLDQACADNQRVREEVEKLLELYERRADFMESPPPGLQATSQDDCGTAVEPGDTLGSYKILERIGEGGMGHVYMAEQSEPVYRLVALKVVKSGMDSNSVIARFEAERQALALMDHPNIARFYEAGMTEKGRPYFVMELVKGRPVTTFCWQHNLDLNSKLALFADVCHAVQHAHQKGIIHRDLKPSNVLVAQFDDRPVPKVIDFGVAKALGEKLTDKTMFTRFGQLVGTLEYMSPEQAHLNQMDVDTRSDIYSLGAILYELLTGEPPFEKERLSSAGLEEVLRIIREDEPTIPSSRISTLTDNRQAETPRAKNEIRPISSIPSDLDWIVMKCLEKERSRRYATANAVADDVRLFLKNEPISAGPPAASYKLRKFLCRNRVAVFVSTLVAASLVIGLGLSVWQAIRATRAEGRATTFLTKASLEAEKTAQANESLRRSLSELQSARKDSELARSKAETESQRATSVLRYVIDMMGSPLAADQANAKVVDVLAEAARNVDSQFRDDPVVAAKILISISDTFTQLERGELAVPIAEKAHQLLLKELGPHDPETLRSFYGLYFANHASAAFSKRLPALALEAKQVLADCGKFLGDRDPATVRMMLVLSDAMTHLHEQAQGDAYTQQALEIAQAWKNDSNLRQDYELVLDEVEDMHQRHGEFEKAIRVAEQLLASYATRLDAGHANILLRKSNLVDYLSRSDQHGRAVKLSRDLLIEFEKKFGKDDRLTLNRRMNHAWILFRSGDRQGARQIAAETAQQAQRVFGPQQTWVHLQGEFARLLWEIGERDAAIGVLKERLRYVPTIFGASEKALVEMQVLESHLRETNRRAEILPLFRDFTAQLEKDFGADNQYVLWANSYLAFRLSLAGSMDEGFDLAKRTLARSELILGLEDDLTLDLLDTIQQQHLAGGRFEKAVEVCTEWLARSKRGKGELDDRTIRAMRQLGVCHYRLENYAAALDCFKKSVEMLNRKLGEDRGSAFTMDEAISFYQQTESLAASTYFGTILGLADCYEKNGDSENASRLRESLMPIVDKEYFAKDQQIASTLARACQVRAISEDNTELAAKAVSILERVVPKDLSTIRPRYGSLATLGECHVFLGNYDRATVVFKNLVAGERRSPSPDLLWKSILPQLGFCELQLGHVEKAEKCFQETLEFIQGRPSQYADDLLECYDAWTRHLLGAVAITRGEVEDGEKLLTEGCERLLEIYDKNSPTWRYFARQSARRVRDRFVETKNPAKVAEWQAKLDELQRASQRN